jgi:hypothetical protein
LFVIAGDQNSDPLDGDSLPGAIRQLLDRPLVNTKRTPASEGGPEQAALRGSPQKRSERNPCFGFRPWRCIQSIRSKSPSFQLWSLHGCSGPWSRRTVF